VLFPPPPELAQLLSPPAAAKGLLDETPWAGSQAVVASIHQVGDVIAAPSITYGGARSLSRHGAASTAG
jgi:hypothetical protein